MPRADGRQGVPSPLMGEGQGDGADRRQGFPRCAGEMSEEQRGPTAKNPNHPRPTILLIPESRKSRSDNALDIRTTYVVY